MSLISDALKTAQRERSGQAPPGPGDQPLLDGFFPYVSTSAPSGRSQRTRIAMISVWSLVALVVVAWFGVPMVKRAVSGRSGKVPPIVLPQGQTAITPVTPPVQVAASRRHPGRRGSGARTGTGNRECSWSSTAIDCRDQREAAGEQSQDGGRCGGLGNSAS